MSATTTVPTGTAGIDTVLAREAGELRQRAVQLRRQADGVDAILATTYRRRASELEMQAWVVEIHAGVPASELHSAA